MKIVNFHKIEGAGSMVASFDVQFKPIMVRGVTLFRKENGETWINEPARKYAGRDGQPAYKKHVLITDSELREVIRQEAIKLLDAESGHVNDVPF